MKNFALALLVSLTTSFLFHAQATASDATDALRYLPVQDAGRIKPYDTFAREALQLVYGSQSYKTGNGVVRPAVEIVTTWMLVPEHWDKEKMVQINHLGLKKALNLPADDNFFSPSELFSNDRLSLVMQELGSFRQTKKKMNPYQQAAQRLESQLGIYQAIKSGQAIRVVPPKPEADAVATAGATAIGGSNPGSAAGSTAASMQAPHEPEKWSSLAELPDQFRVGFANITRAFIQSLPSTAEADKVKPVDPGVPSLEKAVEDFKTMARAQNPALYPNERDIAIEVQQQALHPFKITWIFYLLTALLISIAWQTDLKWLYRAGWVSVLIAFAFHTYGFVLRMYLTGRPPVSNMYESVVWVSWGAMVFALILEASSKRKFVLVAGSIVGTICLIVADIAPTVLDASLQPLEPVLRSNYWLTIHVLTITLSYSALFLGWGLGNIGLLFVLRGDKPTSERVRSIVQSIYRCIQVGVVLLATGIILGGIWADYSWGRFWGWDPKETWALIALLGYLAVLHGRLVGWIQNFGLLACAVVSFNLVIMAWYGVNYVLGAGLHSYGFGAGGIQYVGSFVIFDLIFVCYVAFIRSSQSPGARGLPPRTEVPN
jgi:cytochrome c-type biogenesis protein CcsB